MHADELTIDMVEDPCFPGEEGEQIAQTVLMRLRRLRRSTDADSAARHAGRPVGAGHRRLFGVEPASHSPFSESPCPSDVTAVILEEASCGYLTVPERRDRPDGTQIRLFVVRIDPPGELSSDPMIVVGGELGNRHDYGSLAPMAARTHRQVYLLDQRGSGLS